MALDPTGGYWCQDPLCEHVVLPLDVESNEAPNIGDWEREVAQRYNLHDSWLEPSSNGSICPCCKKVRSLGHYVTDTAVCVFCWVACQIGKCSKNKR